MKTHHPFVGFVLLVATAHCSSSGAPGVGSDAVTELRADELSQDEIMRRVSYLASDEMNGRDEGTPESARARAFIIDELGKCGVKPASADGWEQPIVGGKGTNVLGVIEGRDPSLKDRFVLLGAHYDHIGAEGGKIYNGADDNAAAVSIILGVGCALAKNPPSKSVLVAAWDAEEPPTFLTDQMGSQYYVQHPVIPLEKTDVAIALDLVGSGAWPGYQGHFVMGSEFSQEVRAAVEAAPIPEGLLAMRQGLHLAEETPLRHFTWSDYDAFRNAEKPFLFFSNGQNKRYHQPADQVGALDLAKMTREARYLSDIVRNLANAKTTPVFIPGGTDFGTDLATLDALLSAALAPGGIVETLKLSPASRTLVEGDLAQIRAMKTAGADAGTTSGSESSGSGSSGSGSSGSGSGGGSSGSGGSGPDLTTSEGRAQVMRIAAQRLLCYGGSSFTESMCNGL